MLELDFILELLLGQVWIIFTLKMKTKTKNYQPSVIQLSSWVNESRSFRQCAQFSFSSTSKFFSPMLSEQNQLVARPPLHRISVWKWSCRVSASYLFLLFLECFYFLWTWNVDSLSRSSSRIESISPPSSSYFQTQRRHSIHIFINCAVHCRTVFCKLWSRKQFINFQPWVV